MLIKVKTIEKEEIPKVSPIVDTIENLDINDTKIISPILKIELDEKSTPIEKLESLKLANLQQSNVEQVAPIILPTTVTIKKEGLDYTNKNSNDNSYEEASEVSGSDYKIEENKVWKPLENEVLGSKALVLVPNLDTSWDKKLVKKKFKFPFNWFYTLISLLLIANLGIFFFITQNYLIDNYAKSIKVQMTAVAIDYNKRSVVRSKDIAKIAKDIEKIDTDKCILSGTDKDLLAVSKLQIDSNFKNYKPSLYYNNTSLNSIYKEFITEIDNNFYKNNELENGLEWYNTIFKNQSYILAITNICNAYNGLTISTNFVTSDLVKLKTLENDIKTIKSLISVMPINTNNANYFNQYKSSLDKLDYTDSSFQDGNKNVNKQKLVNQLQNFIEVYETSDILGEDFYNLQLSTSQENLEVIIKKYDTILQNSVKGIKSSNNLKIKPIFL
jgi:hypothetical protein